MLPWLYLSFRDQWNGARVISQKCPWKPIHRKNECYTTHGFRICRKFQASYNPWLPDLYKIKNTLQTEFSSFVENLEHQTTEIASCEWPELRTTENNQLAFLRHAIIYPLYCIKRSWKPTQRTANVVGSHFLFLSQLLDTFWTHFCGTFSADCVFAGATYQCRSIAAFRSWARPSLFCGRFLLPFSQFIIWLFGDVPQSSSATRCMCSRRLILDLHVSLYSTQLLIIARWITL